MAGWRALTLGWLVAAAGCSDECHDIGCGSSLIVELQPSGGFADGSYEVSLTAPQSTEHCTFVIAGGAASMVDCSTAEATLDTSELPTYVLVRYPQDYDASTLNVVVALDGAELANQDHTPEYQDVSIDKNACGGPCSAAQVNVAF